MYFTLSEIIVVFLFGGLCLYFLGAIRVRELAVQAVGRGGQGSGTTSSYSTRRCTFAACHSVAMTEGAGISGANIVLITATMG